jgi:hypothetical protein
MSNTSQTQPVAQLFLGDDAFDEFNSALNSLMQDGARGETVVMVREGFYLKSKTIDPLDLVMGLPEGCEMIVLDGASPEGDAWKTTYHPEQGVCTVVQEAVAA